MQMAPGRCRAYNPGMEVPFEAQIDSWIRDGGVIVTASERTARALIAAYHHRRRTEGAVAWPSPKIQSWSNFAATVWGAYAQDERILLNSAQELALWEQIVASEQHLAASLGASRRRLASLAMDAHELLSSYAPRYLQPAARNAWDRDAAVFSGWLADFDRTCRDDSLLSPARAALETVTALQNDASSRPPVLAIGFDRILPVQRTLFEAWGSWRELSPAALALEKHFYAALDEETELAACARWCASRLAEHPAHRILVVSQQITDRRGEIERAFLNLKGPGEKNLFEFSLGIPLARVPLVRAAHLLLQWLSAPISENQLDWLFSTGFVATDAAESIALQAFMRALRRRSLARPDWTIQSFASQRIGQLPSAWMRRIEHSRRMLASLVSQRKSPAEWSALVPGVLSAAAFSTSRPLSSIEFQAWRRWQIALDTVSSLGFDGRQIPWGEFLSAHGLILDETLFAPESADAPIQIVGPAESAGLIADAIWFLGAEEDSWPLSGPSHPLLPLLVQRESGMPHASPRLDRDLAESMTRRILSSASIVHFSYAAHKAESEARPSRVIVQLVAPPEQFPSQPVHLAQPPHTISFADTSLIPFAGEKIRGGSSTLTAQSQCPFKAFAQARLDAQPWDPTEFGLSAAQRGLLLHAVMHVIWAGPPDGFRSSTDLLACADLEIFVSGHVRTVFENQLPEGIRDSVPSRYLALEIKRLTRVLTDWLAFEKTRAPFSVSETEARRVISLAGLDLDLRLDRIDQLQDGSLLVIDYKTGYVTPNAWQLPRPDDVQLPLYACFGLNATAGGLAFAKVKVGNYEFAGRVRDARSTLLSNLTGNASLVKQPLTDEQLADWKAYIDQLARDFLAGRADVDPRDYPKTCEKCSLHAVCRVHENCIEPEPDDEIEELPRD
jgi:ATP-dependent helicase/nuclease subunit B